MADAQAAAFDRQCLEALRSLGKTLGQLTLYKVGHPAVAETLKLANDQLGAVLAQVAPVDGEEPKLIVVLDGDKVVVNGRIIGSAATLPNVLPGLFKRLKLSSVSFKSGLSHADLVALCELSALRPEQLPADPKAYFEEKGVAGIVFNEASYKILETDLDSALEQASLDAAIQALIGRAVSDPAQQAKVYKKVAELLKADIEKRVDEVVRPLREEKNRLENEQTRTQSVIQNMVEGVIMVDEAGKILMMNPAAEQIYGTTLAQAAGKPLTEKAGEEHVVTLAAEILTPKDRPIKTEVSVAGVDDTKRTVRAAGAVVQNEDGKVVGMVSSLTDAAKHKALQQMQRDFVAHVTHELRAPLSSIRAALEILQGEVAEKLREDEQRMLGTALKNSDRLAELINSILDFSKIESGQMQVFPKKADAEKIAREAVESLAAWASKKRVNLSLSAEPELPMVSADAQRSVQVLINLISNAIKFTPVGGSISVKVGHHKGGFGERAIELSVTDTGPGIPKADQKKIFEKFVQIAAGEMHVGGTGLGLAIAKALVHLQGGKLWVESEEGRGAAFAFTLPVFGGKEKAPAPAAAPAAPASGPALPWWKRALGLK